ncbi:MAG: hypothetical protein QOE93_190 [Actinomycetota bacterium]|nr:hypothetical protein [Actinomycetota bacterium]
MDVMQRPRLCARPGCGEPASATLSFQYATSTVWLDDLGPNREPHTIELCGRHADRLAAPKGWTDHDRRSATQRAAAAADADAALRAQAS